MIEYAENIAFFAALRGDRVCPRCDGSGSQKNTCEACDGSGAVECKCPWCENEHERSCRECSGRGWTASQCQRCCGKGSIAIEEERPTPCRHTLPLFPDLKEAS
jgi:DnaJ-class molecular chaperone